MILTCICFESMILFLTFALTLEIIILLSSSPSVFQGVVTSCRGDLHDAHALHAGAGSESGICC